jgi:hypothetical protein
MRYLVYTTLVMALMLSIASCGGGGGIDLGLEPEDNTAPEISLSGATDGAAYGALEDGADTLNLSAVATDASGIANTAIRINGTLVASANASSAAFDWDVTGYDDGQYEIEVLAYDNNGNVATSSVEVSVNNDFMLVLPDVFPDFPELLIPIWP